MAHFPDTVKLVEVGPRDGLQNEKAIVNVDDKVTLINSLSAAGLNYIEAGSFVSPKWIPQMAASAEVFAQIERNTTTTYAALVPNIKGLDDAIAAKADEIVIFTSASEAFCHKNINCSISESLERFLPVIDKAKALNIPVRGAVSCVLGCPYEGHVAPEQASAVVKDLIDMGCYQVLLGDTIGIGTPASTDRLLNRLLARVKTNEIAGHFHDTYGQALANIYVSLQWGLTTFDCSVAGLGGCPYAKGATGNVATEDVLYMLDGMEIETGVDMDRLVAAGDFISRKLGKPNGSKVANALLKRNQLA